MNLDINFLERYFRDFSWVAIGMMMALLVDFTFYIFAGRLMSPSEFGVFGVLMSLYYIFLQSPFRAIDLTSKKIGAEGRDSLGALGLPALILGLTMFSVFVVFSSLISSVLNIPRNSVLALSLVFPLGYYLSVIVGMVQGAKEFRLYGIYEFFSSLMAFSAIVLVYLGWGATGAILAYVIEILAGLIILIYKKGFNLEYSGFDRFYVLSNSFAFILAVYTAFSLDLIMVSFYFSSEMTGLYNAISVIGKGLFFGAVAINRSVFPKFVTNKAKRMKNLMLSQGLIFFAGIGAAIFFILFGELFITYTFGTDYLSSLEFAPHYMIMIMLLSSLALISNFLISVDDKNILWILLLPVIQFGLILIFNQTVHQVIYATMASVILFIGGFSYIILKDYA